MGERGEGTVLKKTAYSSRAGAVAQGAHAKPRGESANLGTFSVARCPVLAYQLL